MRLLPQGQLLGSAPALFLRYVGWVRRNRLLSCALLLNVLFLFLPFYDANNIPDSLGIITHFTNSSPSLSFNTWAGGPFIINAVFVPGYVVYVASSYSLYAVYTFYKTLNFGLLLILTVVLRRVYRDSSPQVLAGITLFTLANPIWIFMNYIWVQWDIFPVVFLAIGYVLLRHQDRGDAETRLLLSAASVVIAVFFYWFALAAIPAILLYTARPRERWIWFAYITGLSAVVAYVMVEMLAGSLSVYIDLLTGTNPALNRAKYFGFQYYFSVSASEYVALVAILVLAVPLLLKRLRVSEPCTLFAVLTLLIYTSPVPTPELYVIPFPFAVLAVVSPSTARIPWTKLWVSISFPLVGMALINLFLSNSQPDGTGVFFWGYDIFGQNVVFLRTNAQVGLFLTVFNAAISAAVVGSLALVIWTSRGRKEAEESHQVGAPSLVEVNPGARRARRSIHFTHQVARGFTLLVILMVLSVTFNVVLPNTVTYHGQGSIPVYSIVPLFIPNKGNVVRSIPGETYGESGPSLEIYSGARPLEFGRWFQGQSLNFSATENLEGNVPIRTPIEVGSPFNLTLLNLTGPNVSSVSGVKPVAVDNISTLSAPPSIPLSGWAGPSYQFKVNSSKIYEWGPGGFVGEYFAIAFGDLNLSAYGTNLIHINSQGGFLAVVAYPQHDLVVYSDGSTGANGVAINFPGNPFAGSGGYLLFRAGTQGFWVDLEGTSVSVPFIPGGSGNTYLRLGVPFLGQNSTLFALRGNASDLYSSTHNMTVDEQTLLEVSQGGNQSYQHLKGPQLEYTLTSNAVTTELRTSVGSIASLQPTTSLHFGKYVAAPYALDITIHEFSIRQAAPDQYTLIPVFFMMVAPYVLLAFLRRRGFFLRANHPSQGPTPL